MCQLETGEVTANLGGGTARGQRRGGGGRLEGRGSWGGQGSGLEIINDEKLGLAKRGKW